MLANIYLAQVPADSLRGIYAGTTIDSNMEMYIDVKPCNNNVIAPANNIIPPPNDETFRLSRYKQP